MTRVLAVALATIVLTVGVVVAAPKTIEGPATVPDGDTVVVNGISVRLKGVDAPELSMKGGAEAAEGMRAIAGNWLRCELTGEKTHNREVGYCFNAANQDIGRETILRPDHHRSSQRRTHVLHRGGGHRGRIAKSEGVIMRKFLAVSLVATVAACDIAAVFVMLKFFAGPAALDGSARKFNGAGGEATQMSAARAIARPWDDYQCGRKTIQSLHRQVPGREIHPSDSV
jgi:hypothetical protein